MDNQPEIQGALKISARSEKPEGVKECWPLMTFYERFEQIVLMILSFIISLVILFALLQLMVNIYSILMAGVLNPMDYKIFQVIFGMIMTLLIAMEFKHSIIKILERQAHIIQAKSIILLALLALSRKFIIINIEAAEPLKLIALSLSVLVLGVVYWILNQREKPGVSNNQC
ncbi:MAG: phosphate-starvation-inducible PsiE family protein [Methylococcaceae bacterium]|nr:phosphate-starvation-inducible PsiE family protein [Methylococcaceae bacterium]